MIEIFAGRLGGGKSYSATLRIVEHACRGGHTYTNVELHVDAIIRYCRDERGFVVSAEQFHLLTGEQIGRFHRNTPVGEKDCPVLVVVDEAHIWIDQRAFNKKELDEMFFFLTQSRKQNTDVIFISQHQRNLDNRVARLIQYIWMFRDMSKWRIPGLFMKWPFPHLVQSCFDYDGRTLLNRNWLIKDKKIFALYNTDAMLSEVVRSGTAKRVAVKRTRKMTKKTMRVLLWLAIPAIILGAVKVSQIIKAAKSPGKVAQAEAVAAVPAQIGRKTVVVHETLVQRHRPAEPGRTPVGWDCPFITSGGAYRPGKVCQWGTVVTVEGNIATVAGWDGDRVVVVGDIPQPGAEHPQFVAKTGV